MTSPYEDILADARELVKRVSSARRGTIYVSPEVRDLLESVHEATQAEFEDLPSAVPSEEPAAVAEIRTPGPTYAWKETAADVASSAATLEELATLVSGCTKCALCKSRTQTVFSDGNPLAELVFVGEAPGAEEDRQGKPFVGKAGQLLTDIIVKGFEMPRENTYICNVLKCRPPDNRDPSPEEKEQCEPYLVRQLALIKPKVICALGRHAAQTLLKTTESTSRLRGKWHFYHGIPLRVTYHPAYLLRNPEDKRKTWEDVKEILKLLRGEVTLPPRPTGNSTQ